MTLFEQEMNIESYLSWAVTSFILALVLLLIDSISGFALNILNTILYLRIAGYAFLWWGLLNTLKLCVVWQKITSK